MGYTDKKKSALLGLGVSAISMTPTVYAQNEKDLHLYSEKVDSLEFAYTNGHELTFEDEITASIIQEIMCNKRIPFNQIIKLKNATRINTQLNQLIEDGLIEYGESEFHISKVGEPFLRNIAMAFDGFKDSKTQYSTSL